MTTLVATVLSPSVYQVGQGNQFATASPFDLAVSPTSGSTLTPATSLQVVKASGTIAALTIQFPSNVVDGQRLKFISDQTTTALTLTAGTTNGATDTISDAATAGVANTAIEYGYSAAKATWYRVG